MRRTVQPQPAASQIAFNATSNAMLEKLPEALGHALRDQRAGLDKLLFQRVDLRQGMAAIDVRSLAFADHAPMPAKYTADGPGTSPPLQWTGVPAATASVLLLVEDADAPTPQPLVHAIAVGLPPGDGSLPEAALDGKDQSAGEPVHTGRNSYLFSGWLPPDPPPGHGVHRYAFQVFALEADPGFSKTPGRDEVVDAVRRHGIASGLLIGTYTRPDTSERVGAANAASVGVPVSPTGAGPALESRQLR